jgi:hypothetical protein
MSLVQQRKLLLFLPLLAVLVPLMTSLLAVFVPLMTPLLVVFVPLMLLAGLRTGLLGLSI